MDNPRPPYSSAIAKPNRPMSLQVWRSSSGTASFSSISGSSGITRSRTKRRTESRTSWKSSAFIEKSDPDPLSELLAVVRRVTEKQLVGLGALEVQVGGVLPGETDAAVDLDVLGSAVHVRV